MHYYRGYVVYVMKKLGAFIAILIAFIAIAFVCWRYFDRHFKEYDKLAECEISSNDEVYFLDNSFIKITSNSLEIYGISEDGGLVSKLSAVSSDIKVVFISENYIIVRQDDRYYVYAENANLIDKVVIPNGKFYSAHQFGNMLCIKVQENEFDTVIYTYKPDKGLENITNTVDFSFVDYFVDTKTGVEYYISYEAEGEFVTLCLRTADSNVAVEFDDTVYRSFDYVDGLFVFYTDSTMVFVNMNTLVKTSQNCYDIDKLIKFIYNNRYVYYLDDAYFDGVNNILVVNGDSSKLLNFRVDSNLYKYGDKLIYVEGKYIKSYAYGDSILEDNILFTEENVEDIGVMGDVIALIKKDKIIFMKLSA